LSGTTRVSQYQKGKTNLDFTEARDSEWQWHQLGRMQVCTLLQTDHASTPPVSFLQAGYPACHPTTRVVLDKRPINGCVCLYKFCKQFCRMVQVVTGTHGGETLAPLAWKYKLIVATSIKRMFCFVSFPDSGFFSDVYTHSPAHTVYSQYNNNNNHLTAVCPGQPG